MPLIEWAVYAGLTALSSLLSPHAKRPPGLQLKDLRIPTATEDKIINYIVGTVSISPNVVWYGDLALKYATYTRPNPEPYKPPLRLLLKGYHLGMHMTLCHGPIDDVIEMRFDDKVIPSTATDFGTYKRFTINQPFFHGDDAQGGIIGDFDVYLGDATQTASNYLTSPGVAANPYPAYRGLAHVVARQPMWSATPDIRPVSFVVRRCPNQLGLTGGKQNINGDANPACILYEAMITCGMSPASIDTASLIAVGNTLFTEGFGLSIQLDRPTTLEDFIDEILRYVDGYRYEDRATGLFTIKLARADYSVPALPILTEDDVEDFKFARPSWNQTKNSVKVRYVDRAANYKDRIAIAQDIANIKTRGDDEDVVEADCPWISTAANAQTMAGRILRQESFGLATFDMVSSRAAWDFHEGQPFRLQRPSVGILDMVCRVTGMTDGELRAGNIPLKAAEDIFGVGSNAYAAPGSSGWSDPVSAPTAFPFEQMIEAPYALAGGAFRRVLTLAVRGSVAVAGYEVWTDPAGGTAYSKTGDVGPTTPSGTLADALTITATSFIVTDGPDMNLLDTITAADLALGRNLLLIDSELIAWQTIVNNGDGTWTISGAVRGVIDTVPAVHSGAARVWFLSDGSGGASDTDYAADLTLKAKFLPYNSKGTLAIASATQRSITTNNRAGRAYSPTGLLVNGLSYPASFDGELALSWSHRNRLGQWSYANAGASATKEGTTTYNIRLYDGAGVLKKTYSGLTGTSQNWTTEVADAGGLLGTIRIEIEAVLSSVVSYQFASHTVIRSTTNEASLFGRMQAVARTKLRKPRGRIISSVDAS